MLRRKNNLMVVHELLQAQAPLGLILIVLLLQWTSYEGVVCDRALDFVEVFAGDRAVSKMLRLGHLIGHSHDKTYLDTGMDILGNAGFALVP